ncbi:MAG TPA: hypothetical protein VEG39_18275 [Clostridia bacterium]|nr:hypothetical protein [Clostridia bacterium]
MKKLLFNKSRLILLAVIFIICTLMGLLSAEGSLALRKSDDYSEYIRLVSENTGKLNPEQLAEFRAISEATEAEYRKGNEDGFYMYLHHNPVQKFHNDYTKFGERVHEYWNGPEYQNEANIMGVYPIQEKLKELSYKTDIYEYKYYKNRLDTELSLGKPVFENTLFWNNFSLAFDPSRVGFLLLMFLAFIISPVFTQEVKTDMDSIVLCSVKGRREIVTAKLLCVCATSAILTTIFFLGMFFGTYIFNGNINGFDAPARCFAGFAWTTLDTTVVCCYAGCFVANTCCDGFWLGQNIQCIRYAGVIRSGNLCSMSCPQRGCLPADIYRTEETVGGVIRRDGNYEYNKPGQTDTSS